MELVLHWRSAPPEAAPRDHAQLSEEGLLALARRGDSDAFDELVRRHSARVLALATRLVGPVEGWDVAQEVFLAAHRTLQSFRGEAALSTWLYRITMNLAYRALRRRREVVDLAELEMEPAPRESPQSRAESSQLKAAIARAISLLPWQFRTVFTLREVSGLDYQEIAQVMGTNIGTVKSRLARARSLLRELLVGEGYAELSG